MVEWHMHEFRQDALPTLKPVSPDRQRMLTDVGLAPYHLCIVPAAFLDVTEHTARLARLIAVRDARPRCEDVNILQTIVGKIRPRRPILQQGLSHQFRLGQLGSRFPFRCVLRPAGRACLEHDQLQAAGGFCLHDFYWRASAHNVRLRIIGGLGPLFKPESVDHTQNTN
jgi:hypothetical protein